MDSIRTSVVKSLSSDWTEAKIRKADWLESNIHRPLPTHQHWYTHINHDSLYCPSWHFYFAFVSLSQQFDCNRKETYLAMIIWFESFLLKLNNFMNYECVVHLSTEIHSHEYWKSFIELHNTYALCSITFLLLINTVLKRST